MEEAEIKIVEISPEDELLARVIRALKPRKLPVIDFGVEMQF